MQDEINNSQELTASQESLADVFPQEAMRHLNFEIPSDIDLFSSGEDRQSLTQIDYAALSTIVPDSSTTSPTYYEGLCPAVPDSSTTKPTHYEALSAAVPDSSSTPNPTHHQSASQMQNNQILPPDALPGLLSSIPSTICAPPTSTWKGDYGFDVYFRAPDTKTQKGANWIYSTPSNKLYVVRNVPIPIDIVTTRNVPDGCTIRVVAVFSQPSHAQILARRCVHHAMQDQERGVIDCYHLIRCEHASAVYEMADNCPLAVSVLYERPPVGENQSTYLYKFTCFGSCSGGPNRRPLLIIFTLEKGGIVLGRRSVHIKICACPTRDFGKEEKREAEQEIKESPKKSLQPKKRKADCEPFTDHVADIFDFMEKLKGSAKKSKGKDESGPFVITVHNQGLYRLLLHVMYLFHLQEAMSCLPQNLITCLQSFKKPKRDGDSSDTSD